jgi:hypothetical protein
VGGITHLLFHPEEFGVDLKNSRDLANRQFPIVFFHPKSQPSIQILGFTSPCEAVHANKGNTHVIKGGGL